jgi:hypothetical protein
MATGKEPPPIAFVQLERFGGDTPNWKVVDCPYCGREHRHGAVDRFTGDPWDNLGERRSHCSGGDEYILVPVPEQPRPSAKEIERFRRLAEAFYRQAVEVPASYRRRA